MQAQLAQALSKILAAVSIQSPGSFWLGGQVITIDDSQRREANAEAETESAPLVRQLVAHLYHRCYSRPFEEGVPGGPMRPQADDDFVQQLSAANTSRDRLSRGWQLLRLLPTEHYIAQKDGLVRILATSECQLEPGSATDLNEGGLISVPWSRQSTTIQPTFYFAFGEAIGDQQDDADLMKVYWNIRAAGMPLLMRLLTQRLNRFRIPFRLKCLNNPTAYTRADAAVLFMSRRFYDVAEVLLAGIVLDVKGYLDVDVPLFSKRLAGGVGVAEEPDNGESFGQQRCRMLAEAIWNAHRLHLRGEHERLEAVAEHFELHGLSLDTPHLNPGSVDRYESFQERSHRQPFGRQGSTGFGNAPSCAIDKPDTRFLETAAVLGARLCSDAIWAGKRCNWVGAATFESKGGTRVPAQRACGIDLFSGTSGIALFLAHLYAATGEAVFGVTAEAAIRQALSRLDDLPSPTRIDFHTGLTGISYVLVEIAALLNVPKFATMAWLILEDVASNDPRPDGPMLVSRNAAAIPALLHIHRGHPNDAVLQLALDHGERLLDLAAQVSPQTAWSLLELWHQTGDNRFRHAAEQAVARLSASLPDRLDAAHLSPPADAAPTHWLYRLSGIGLVKLRAFELLGVEHDLTEARTALGTVVRFLSASSDAAPEDFSLNHGQPGDAELLLRARRTVNDDSYVVAAERVGNRGIELFGVDDRRWPCSAPSGAEAPGLMIGLAGIGYFYLRLHDPLRTPSLLMMSTPSKMS